MGIPLEDVLVEADRGVVLTGVELEPVGRAWLGEDAETLVGAGLPQSDGGLTGVRHHGHGAEVHDVHGGHHDLTAVVNSGVDGGLGVICGEVNGPDVRRARLPVVLHATGDEDPILREVDVAAEFLTGIDRRPAEQLAVEVLALVRL
jgi:hypothetical protein